MKALVRKELVELGLSFVPILLAICLIWLATFWVEDALIWPAEFRMMTVLLTAAGGGLLFASTQFAGERIRGTWGFLVHRGAGLEGCFRIKVWIGVSASVLLGVLPPLVLALVHATVFREARVIHWSRLVEYMAASSAGASAYAITAFSLSLRRGFWSEAILAIVGVAGWLVLCLPTSRFVAERLDLFVNDPRMLAGFTAVQIGLGAVLLRQAGRMLASWRDPSLTLASPHHVAAILVGAFVWIPIQVLLLAAVQGKVGRSFQERAPLILRDRTGGGFLVAVPNGNGSYSVLREGRLVADERLVDFHPFRAEKMGLEVVHEPRTPSLDRRELDDMYRRIGRIWSWEGFPGSAWDRTYGSPVGSYWTSLWMDHAAGCLRLFAIGNRNPVDSWSGPSSGSAPPPEIPFERVVQKPSGRFSSSANVLGAVVRKPVKTESGVIAMEWLSDGVLPKCIADPEDGTLWRLDPDFSSSLRKLELPNGDRFVGVGESFYARKPLRVGSFQPWFSRCIRGEKGYYEWNGSELVAIDLDSPEAYGIPADLADALIEIRTDYKDTDPLFPTVEVRDARTNAVLLTHRYAPTRFGDSVLAGALHLGATLRPPALDLISYLQSTSEPLRFNDLLVEPLLANRSRTWLLAASFLLSISLARIAMRRARARGASSAVVGLSAALVVAIGVPGFLMVWMLESRRSGRREPARVEPRAEPVVLIETARAT